MSEEIILEAVGVTKRFGGLTAVDEVSFSIKPRTIKALIGPNGAGKSTMLNMLSGVYRPTSGTIRMKGKRIDNRKPYQNSRVGSRSDIPDRSSLREYDGRGERNGRPAHEEPWGDFEQRSSTAAGSTR